MDRLPIIMLYLVAVGFLILALHVTRSEGVAIVRSDYSERR